MRRGISVLLAIVLVLSLVPASVFAAESKGMDNFVCDGSYRDGLFTDVTSDKWYAKGVAVVYELGLMSGMGDGTFAPENNVRISEVISMAARLHRIYETGSDQFEKSDPWYQTFVDYAIENSIIKQGEFTNFDAPATRAEMVHIFAATLPSFELEPINIVSTLPDVTSNTKYVEEIFRLYRAGILAGNDSKGTFTPEQPISRCQAAAIIARMALKQQRVTTNFSTNHANTSTAITTLPITRTSPIISEVNGIKPYAEFWANNNVITGDFSQERDFINRLTIDRKSVV